MCFCGLLTHAEPRVQVIRTWLSYMFGALLVAVMNSKSTALYSVTGVLFKRLVKNEVWLLAPPFLLRVGRCSARSGGRARRSPTGQSLERLRPDWTRNFTLSFWPLGVAFESTSNCTVFKSSRPSAKLGVLWPRPQRRRKCHRNPLRVRAVSHWRARVKRHSTPLNWAALRTRLAEPTATSYNTSSSLHNKTYSKSRTRRTSRLSYPPPEDLSTHISPQFIHAYSHCNAFAAQGIVVSFTLNHFL